MAIWSKSSGRSGIGSWAPSLDRRRLETIRGPQRQPSPLDLPLRSDLSLTTEAIGLLAKLTRQRRKRGVFRFVVNRFVEENNADPKPFV